MAQGSGKNRSASKTLAADASAAAPATRARAAGKSGSGEAQPPTGNGGSGAKTTAASATPGPSGAGGAPAAKGSGARAASGGAGRRRAGTGGGTELQQAEAALSRAEAGRGDGGEAGARVRDERTPASGSPGDRAPASRDMPSSSRSDGPAARGREGTELARAEAVLSGAEACHGDGTSRGGTQDRPGASGTPPMPALPSAEERLRLIREVAYRMYRERGGGHGSDVDDWLHAERRVDAMLRDRGSGPPSETKERR